MKKRTIISLLLVACMATMCFVGGTFAKYASEVSGKDTVRVAKWIVGTKAGEVDFEEAAAATIDIFKDTVNYDEADNDVKPGLIAPGTLGEFEFVLANDSEVTAEYTITYAVEDTHNTLNVPIEWSVDGGTTWGATIDAAITAAGAEYAKYSSGEIAIDGADVTLDINWRWAFNDTETEDDTTLGTADQVNVTVTITVLFEQVD